MKIDRAIAKTAGLAAAFAVLAAYVYFVEIRYKNERTARTEEAKKILPLGREAVTAIEIRNAAAVLAFEREGTGAATAWKMTKPLPSPTNENKVGALLAGLLGLVPESTVAEKAAPEELAEYGLDPAKAPSVSLKTGEGQRRLYLGALNPAGTSFYLRTDTDERVFLAAKSLREDLLREPAFYRDRRVAKFSSDAITGLRIEQGNEAVELAKENDRWNFSGGAAGDSGRDKKENVDETKVSTFLMDLTLYAAKDFIDSPAPAVLEALSRPALKITLTSKDGMKQTIAMGAVLEGKNLTRLARNGERGPVLAVDQDFMGKFAKRREDFISRKITGFEPWNAARAVIASGGKTYRLEMMDFRWLVTEPADLKGREADLSDLLWEIKSLEYKNILPPARAQGVQTAALEFFDKDGARLEKIALYETAEGLAATAAGKGAEVYEIDPGLAANVKAVCERITAPREKAGQTPETSEAAGIGD